MYFNDPSDLPVSMSHKESHNSVIVDANAVTIFIDKCGNKFTPEWARSVVRISWRSSEPQAEGSKPSGPGLILSLYLGPLCKKSEAMVYSADAQDTMACFLYALQSPISKKK